jgi:AraC-like DNA-binding protein
MDLLNRQKILQYWHAQLQAWKSREVTLAGLAPRNAGPGFTQPWRALELVISGCHPVTLWRHGAREHVSLRPGQCVYLPAGSWRTLIWDEPSVFLGIVIRDTCLRFLVADIEGDGTQPRRNPWQFHTASAPSAAIVHVGRCLDELALRPEPSPAAVPLMEALCRLCVEELEKETPRLPGKAHHTWQGICSYVEERLGTPISRLEVAAAMGVSPAYVSRLFRQKAGVGFNEYLTRLRLDLAARLLRETELRGKEVASRVGFTDERYFIRVFHQKMGMPPGRYRRHTH